jgi:hypothetical protein
MVETDLAEIDEERVPNRDHAFVEPAKLTEYLLNPKHPVGGDKAAYFFRFGFRTLDWQGMQTSLIDHVQDARVVNVRSTLYGTHYTVEGRLKSPDGGNPRVRTVWSVSPQDQRPRFLTAYPGRRGGQL